MKRTWGCIIILGISVLMLTFYVKRPQENNSIFVQWKELKKNDIKETVTINYLIPSSWYNRQSLKTIIKKFEEKTGYNVDVQVVIDEQYDSIIKAKLKNEKDIDIFFGAYQQYDVSNTMIEMDIEGIKDRIIPGVIESLYYNNKVYGYPISAAVNVYGIYYNKDIFKKYGIEIPKTLHELNEVGKVLKKNNIIPFYFALGDSWTLLQHRNSVNGTLIKEGNDIWEKLSSNKVTWDLPPLVEQYDALEYWINNEYVNSDGAIKATYSSQINEFVNGKYAMVFQGSWFVNDVQKLSEDVDIGFFPLPTENGENPITFSCFSGGAHIAKTSKVKNEAKEFLEFLVAPEQVELYLKENKGISPYKDVHVELDGVFQDIEKYIKENNISPHGDDIYPVLLPKEEIIRLYQELFNKKITSREFIKEYQEVMINSGLKMNMEGFK